MRTWLLAGVLATTACAHSTPRPHPPSPVPDRSPRELAADAQLHYDRGEYSLAIDEYREAYRREPSPGVLFNLGQAYRLDGACLPAARMYGAYLRVATEGAPRDLAAQHLARLAPCADAEEHAVRARARRHERHAGLALGLVGALFAGTGGILVATAPPPVDPLRDHGGDPGGWGDPLVSGSFLVAGLAFGVGATLYALGQRDEPLSWRF